MGLFGIGGHHSEGYNAAKDYKKSGVLDMEKLNGLSDKDKDKFLKKTGLDKASVFGQQRTNNDVNLDALGEDFQEAFNNLTDEQRQTFLNNLGYGNTENTNPNGQIEQSQQDISALEADYNEKNQAIITKEQELDNAHKTEMDKLNGEVTKLQGELSKIKVPAEKKDKDGKVTNQNDIEAKQKEIEDKQTEIANKQAEIERKESEFQQKKEQELSQLKQAAEEAKTKLDEAKNSANNQNSIQTNQTLEQLQASGGHEATLPELQQQEQVLRGTIEANSDGSYSNLDTIKNFTGAEDFSKMSAADKQAFGLNDEDIKRLSSKPPQFLSGNDDEVKAKLTKMAQAKAKADGIDLNANDDKTKQYKAQMESKINKYVNANKANNDLYMNFQYQKNLMGVNTANNNTKPQGVPNFNNAQNQDVQETKTLSSEDSAALKGGGKISDKLNTELTTIGRNAYQQAVKNGDPDPEKAARLAVRQELSSRGASFSEMTHFNTDQLGKFSEVDKPMESQSAKKTQAASQTQNTNKTNQKNVNTPPQTNGNNAKGNIDSLKSKNEEITKKNAELAEEARSLSQNTDEASKARLKEIVKELRDNKRQLDENSAQIMQLNNME